VWFSRRGWSAGEGGRREGWRRESNVSLSLLVPPPAARATLPPLSADTHTHTHTHTHSSNSSSRARSSTRAFYTHTQRETTRERKQERERESPKAKAAPPSSNSLAATMSGISTNWRCISETVRSSARQLGSPPPRPPRKERARERGAGPRRERRALFSNACPSSSLFSLACFRPPRSSPRRRRARARL
jgi:hypothetical protein